MSVYVDRLRSTDSKTGLKRWCKLWGDTGGQRAAMANALHLPIHKFVSKADPRYYEITPEQRQQAITEGALMWTVREWKHDQKRKENKR